MTAVRRNSSQFDTTQFDPSSPLTVGSTVRESNKAVCIEIEVPRYRPEDLTYTVDSSKGEVTVVGKQPEQLHPQENERLLFSSTPMSGFRRTYHVSPNHFDLGKITTRLECGVFTLIAPRLANTSTEPVTVFGENNKDDRYVPNASSMEVSDLRHSHWPPSIRVSETSTGLTYRCQLPASVQRDHIELQLVNNVLKLTVHYIRRVQTEHHDYSETASYSTSWTVPDGTLASDVHTTYTYGLLTVYVDNNAHVTRAR